MPRVSRVFFSGGGNTEFVKIAPNGYCEGVLSNLGTAIYEGKRAPKGITRCEAVTKFMDYSINSRIDGFEEIPDFEYFIDDWDSSRITYIREIQPGLYYQIESKGVQFDWSLFLNGSASLNIRYFDKQGDLFLLAGEFQGTLTVGGNQIASEVQKSGFYVRINESGQVLDYNLIRGLNPNKRTNFVRGDTGIRVVGYPSDQSVSVNGSAYPVLSNSLTDIAFENNVDAQVRSIPINDLSYSIERVSKRTGSAVSGAVTYLLKKNTGTSGDQIKLLTTDPLGNALWSKSINTNLNASDDFDIKYSAQGDLIVALTFSGSINVDGTVITSAGGSDVALFRFDDAGVLKKHLQYGSTDNENVSQLFLEDDVFYFGGEFLGATATRTIGKHQFISLSNNVSTPYISFVIDSDLLPPSRPAIDAKRNNTTSGQKIAVFPNPVADELIVRIEGAFSDGYHVKMFDMMGKLIRDSKFDGTEGGNEIHLSNLKEIPPGVYMVEVLLASEPVFHTKIVKE